MENTLKSTAETKHGKGMCRGDTSRTPIPGNWQEFPCVDGNKTDPLQFLSHTLIDLFNLKEKQLIITVGECVLSKPLLDDLDSISSCTHEGADTTCCCMLAIQQIMVMENCL